MVKAFLLAAAVTLLVAPASAGEMLPRGFPLPHAEPGNPASEAKVALGRRLFYEERLSANGRQSCASCHQQKRAFTDGLATAVGSTGQRHSLNTQTLTNVAYNASYTWSNVKIRSLERQALVPMLNRHPVELGLAGQEREILRRFREDPAYALSFREAFPGQRRPVSLRNISRALASFERTLISGRSAFDRAVYDGAHEALSPAAWRGMQIFFSQRAACSECHAGFNLSGPARHVGAAPVRPTAITNGITAGRFRTPTLRNVELTAPYMHDGSIATLAEVIDRYSDVRRLGLSDSEKGDLVAFLQSLTDHEFVNDARFSDPEQAEERRPLAGWSAGFQPAQ
jgi:cytochrome c peroxidase